MSVADEFLQANQQYAGTFDKADLPVPPGRRVAVVACMDARLDPARFLGLQEGDAFEVRDAQNFFGPPLVMGVYDGLPVTIPMNLTEVTPLVGRVTHFANRHTAPEFGVFVVMRR